MELVITILLQTVFYFNLFLILLVIIETGINISQDNVHMVAPKNANGMVITEVIGSGIIFKYALSISNVVSLSDANPLFKA